ncbi:hypothetical protein [Neobacillus terrae]|uniref:hypothetical protein n=1 Tax=Neobacillus terrae TaxID=3034837 RepID=UPI00140CEA50|nr:hypothetical protein [Neobacillus terrae]NHM29290.1 hypothetical protein [Neobacillus terrae]
MESIYVNIGDHVLHILLKVQFPYKSFIKNFKKILNKQSNLEITIYDDYGLPFKNYDVEITSSSNQIKYRRADYLIQVDKDFKHATIHVHNELALKHAMMNLYSAFLVHNKWGLLIHSSCAIENGKGHLFSGQSGAGKSTAAKLSFPRDLLSDEASLVKIENDSITVFNSPFRSELEAGDYQGSVELNSIQLLHQSPENNRVKLDKSDALIQLMDKVFFWPHSPEETKTIMKLLSTLVKQVPVYDLSFQKNNTFWELIS